MLRQLRIGPRLAAGFAAVMSLAVAMAATGHLGLEHVAHLTSWLINEEGRLSALAARGRAKALNLRRFEKDYLLNMGTPQAQAPPTQRILPSTPTFNYPDLSYSSKPLNSQREEDCLSSRILGHIHFNSFTVSQAGQLLT